MKCQFKSGGFYELKYEDKTVKNVGKNTKVTKTTRHYTSVDSQGYEHGSYTESYDYKIDTEISYTDGSMETIENDIPVLSGWTVRFVYFNGARECLVKKFVLENKYEIFDSATNPKTIIYDGRKQELNDEIVSNKKSVGKALSWFGLLITFFLFMQKSKILFKDDTFPFVQNIPAFVWYIGMGVELLLIIIFKIRIAIKNKEAKKEFNKFFVDNEEIIEETYEKFCNYIMCDRQVGRSPEPVSDIEIKNETYHLQVLDKVIICVEKLPVVDNCGKKIFHTRIYYDDFTSEYYKKDIAVNAGNNVRYINFFARKNELLCQFIREDGQRLNGSGRTPKSVILSNLNYDMNRQIEKNKNFALKRITEIILPLVLFAGILCAIGSFEEGLTVKETLGLLLANKYGKHILLVFLTEFILFISSHVHVHNKNKDCAAQNGIYKRCYERNIDSLMDTYNALGLQG